MDEYERPAYENWSEDEWLDLFRSVVSKTIVKGEQVEDIMTGAWFLGRRRAQVIDREFQTPVDVQFALSLFCWWPIKFTLFSESWQYLAQRRWAIFEGAAENPERVETLLSRVVPKSVLTLDHHQLMGLLQVVHVRHFLNLEEDFDDFAQGAKVSSVGS